MTSQANLDKFNEFYKETYSNILRYIIIKCHNINDVNDISRDVYLELWTNINSYLIGIAINKIKKYYSLVMRIRDISLFDKNNNDLEIIDKIDSSFDIESLLIKDEEWKSIWNFIKKKKNHINNNYTSIRKKMERGNKMNKIFKYSLVPMAIVITMTGVFLLNKKSITNNVLDSNVKNNDVIIFNNIDNNFDNAKLDIDGRSEDITTDDLYKIYPLLKDIVVPNDYNINGIIKCYLFNENTGKYDKLYGYNIIYSGGNNLNLTNAA